MKILVVAIFFLVLASGALLGVFIARASQPKDCAYIYPDSNGVVTIPEIKKEGPHD